MARWQKRQEFLPSQTVNYGSTLRWEITREFPIEAIYLATTYQITSNTAQPTSVGFPLDGPWNIYPRIQLQIADGGRTRHVVDCSGIGLMEYYRQIAGACPAGYANERFLIPGTNAWSSYQYTMWHPIPFSLPNISDPIASCLCLPAPRYNSNLILSVQTTSAQTDWINAAGGTAVVLTVSAKPIIIRRDIRDPNWVYLDTELAELPLTLASGTKQSMFELQIPGSYTGLLMRGYRGTSTIARGDVSCASTGNLAGGGASVPGEYSLRLLGNVIRRFNWMDVQLENEQSIWSPSTGAQSISPANQWTNNDLGASNIYLDFLNDKPGQIADHFGSVLDTNPLMATGARLQMFVDTASGLVNTPQLKLVSHRIFGDLSTFKPQNSPGA